MERKRWGEIPWCGSEIVGHTADMQSQRRLGIKAILSVYINFFIIFETTWSRLFSEARHAISKYVRARAVIKKIATSCMAAQYSELDFVTKMMFFYFTTKVVEQRIVRKKQRTAIASKTSTSSRR